MKYNFGPEMKFETKNPVKKPTYIKTNQPGVSSVENIRMHQKIAKVSFSFVSTTFRDVAVLDSYNKINISSRVNGRGRRNILERPMNPTRNTRIINHLQTLQNCQPSALTVSKPPKLA